MNQFIRQALMSVGPFVARAAMGVLKSVLNAAYKAFWRDLFAAVVQAEKTIKTGSLKREVVVIHILDFIMQKRELKGFKLRATRILVGKIVDQVIGELNKSGKNWVEIVSNLEEKLNLKLEIINPL